MSIVWNKVTWYSKLLAVIFFIAIFPAITFCIGREYQETIALLESDYFTPVYSKNSQKIESGIKGKIEMDGKPYVEGLRIQSAGKQITVETTPNSLGKFFVILPAGDYLVSPLLQNSVQNQNLVHVKNESFTELSLTLR